MRYCGPRGIPYEQWLGVATGWTGYSRAAALVWQAREDDRCGGCGQQRSDWLDDDGIVLEEPPFELVEYACPSCGERQRYEREAREEEKAGVTPIAGLQLGFRRLTASEVEARHADSAHGVNEPGAV